MKSKLQHIFLVCATLLSVVKASAQVNTEQVLRIGQNAMYFEDYVLSIQYFNQVIHSKPYLAAPYLYRAIAKFNLDDLAGAEADASKAIELNKFLTDAWEVRGVARQNMGKNAEAISDYAKALELLPHNRQIMFNQALAMTETADTAAADSAFKVILRYYPNFANAYIGYAKLQLERSDTVSASASIDKALSLNPNLLNGYVMRAAIAIDSKKDYKTALDDMDRAVKLEPRLAGLYINRAFLRYMLDDYFGAMADYDYCLMLDPLNAMALFNRSLLEMEVGDNDKALSDLNKILQLDPDEYRARYNRAVVLGQKKEYAAAIDDINHVIERFPDFSGALYLRSEFLREQGHLARAKADADKAYALAKAATDSDEGSNEPEELTPEAAARRFNTLLTTENETPINEEYNNSAIRGRVQDHNLAIELEPLIELSFYSSPTEVKSNTYYIKDVDDLNATRMLRFIIVATPNPPMLTDESLIQRHFSSIEYYNSYLATHEPRAIDYIGRALDFITVKNYEAALADLDRAIALTPDHSVAYQLRAQARYHARQLHQANDGGSAPKLNAKDGALSLALIDYDKAIELQPLNAVAWFNKGNVLYEMGDYTSAIAAYTRAIELQPMIGEAYYNRGYLCLKLGNQAGGIADLSKAGEMGIVSAYNLIKRMSKSK